MVKAMNVIQYSSKIITIDGNITQSVSPQGASIFNLKGANQGCK